MTSIALQSSFAQTEIALGPGGPVRSITSCNAPRRISFPRCLDDLPNASGCSESADDGVSVKSKISFGDLHRLRAVTSLLPLITPTGSTSR
jgi:hypothetical protein